MNAPAIAIPARAGRRRDVGYSGISVRDDWQRKGVGTALMRAIVRDTKNRKPTKTARKPS